MVDTLERTNPPGDGVAVENGRSVRQTTPYRSTDFGTDVVVQQDARRPKNRVQWGPVIAGTVTALTTMLILGVLGLAVGTSAFEPGTDASDWGTGAGIWGGISAVIALFLGGWVAARSAAVGGEYAGLLNGFLSGAATLLVLLWLTTTGVTNALGFLGTSVSDITGVTDQATFDQVENGAWGTLIALVVALGAATLGGLLGHNDGHDIDRATA